jgi:hypothetical protein
MTEIFLKDMRRKLESVGVLTRKEQMQLLDIAEQQRLTNKELKLLEYFLDDYGNDLSNRGCNDVPENVWKDWSIDERKNFVKAYHDYNGGTEEFDENFLHLPDYCIVSFLRHKLKG